MLHLKSEENSYQTLVQLSSLAIQFCGREGKEVKLKNRSLLQVVSPTKKGF